MKEKREYAILHFVQQKSYCHMVHDNSSGQSIMEYAKEKRKIDKSKAFHLAVSLAEQLELFYRCEEQKAYGYLTPYAVIITEEGDARLLDIWADENKEQVAKMNRKKVRMLFIRSEYVLSQKRRPEDDWYGYGKTIQFLMEKCCESETLSRYEKHVLQKLYENCDDGKKASLDNWRSIQKLLQRIQIGSERRKKIELSRPILLLATASLLLGTAFGKQLMETPEPLIVEKEVEVPVEVESDGSLIAYAQVLELLQKEELDADEKKSIEDAIQVVVSGTSEEEKDWLFQKCVAKGYEKAGRYEAAIVAYEEVLKVVEDVGEQMVTYKKLIDLYDFMDLPEKMKETYVEAIEKFPELKEEETILDTEK